MVQETVAPVKPPWTGIMAGWVVFVGFYQIFLASRHGGIFLGQNNLARQDLSTTALVVLYIVMGILFFIMAFSIWNVRWWAYPLCLLVQGMVIAVATMGIVRWLALDQNAPVVWDALDLLFAVFNLWWATSIEVRSAFMGQAVRVNGKTESNPDAGPS